MVRPVLAAFVIVMVRKKIPGWVRFFKRVSTVMAGCIIALVLTVLFGLLVPKDFSEKKFKP